MTSPVVQDGLSRNVPSKDAWEEIAKSYVSANGDPTTPPSIAFLSRVNQLSPFSGATSVLDNGCGPCMVMKALLSTFGDQIPATTKLFAADFSPAMIKQVEKLKDEKVAAGESVWSRVETKVQDAQLLDGYENETFSHVLAGMMYMLVQDPQKALKATYRTLKPGGVIAFSSWHSAEWMDLMTLVDDVNPEAKTKTMLPAAYRSSEGLKAELEEAGFKDIHSEYVPTTMTFEDHRKTAKFFIEKIPIMVQAMQGFSQEQSQQLEQMMVDQLKGIHHDAPGRMNGKAVIAVARK